MRDVVLVITNSGDSSVNSVLDHLNRSGQPFCRFNTESFPDSARLTLFHLGGEKVGGTLCVAGGHGPMEIDITSIKSVWTRRPVGPILKEPIHSGYAHFIREEAGVALWSLYSVLDGAFWMNPPLIASRLLEHNKLYQLGVAASIGMATPHTVITNNPDEVLSLVRTFGGVAAIKMLKGNFFTKEGSHVPHLVFTQRVTEETVMRHLDDFRLAPVMVQEYIPKDIELRVTIVNETVFACAIHSQDSKETMHDWRRYDHPNVRHEPYQMPTEVEKQLISLMKLWRLSYGAFDLIRTPDGRYVFLEVNANGQWGWIEELTGMPISKEIAETLIAAPSTFATVPWSC